MNRAILGVFPILGKVINNDIKRGKRGWGGLFWGDGRGLKRQMGVDFGVLLSVFLGDYISVAAKTG